MEKILLFTRKFNGETYKFYMNKGVGCFGVYSEYVSVEMPKMILDIVIQCCSTKEKHTL